MQFSTPKLSDCTRHGAGSELFIVEGNSAAAAVERLRSPTTQAVLPMQGKPMNAMKSGAEELSENVQFRALLDALGGERADALDSSSFRYERFILLFDPDADGIHSSTLLLLFFYRWLPELLDHGRVLSARPPQWAITAERLEGTAYASTSKHLEQLRSHLQASGAGKITTKRFRGLANVPAQVISSRCINPATRELRCLTREDALNALDLFERMRDLASE